MVQGVPLRPLDGQNFDVIMQDPLKAALEKARAKHLDRFAGGRATQSRTLLTQNSLLIVSKCVKTSYFGIFSVTATDCLSGAASQTVRQHSQEG